MATKTIKKDGQEFIVVTMKSKTLSFPIPRHPIKTLQEEGEKLPKGISIKELRKEILKQAYKDL